MAVWMQKYRMNCWLHVVLSFVASSAFDQHRKVYRLWGAMHSRHQNTGTPAWRTGLSFPLHIRFAICHNYSLGFLLSAFALTANAITDSVSPLQSDLWYAANSGIPASSTPAAACNAYNSPSYYLYSSSQIYTLGPQLSSGQYNCFRTILSGPNAGYSGASGSITLTQSAICPVATPAYTYNPSSGMCERTIPDQCPVSPLPALPTDDLCAQSLEAGSGSDINHMCPSLTPEMKKQVDCLATKIRQLALPIPYAGPSATIRNAAYQKHLRDVWDKWEEIGNTPMSDEEKLACATIIADVKDHMDRHAFDSAPSKKRNEAPHVLGNAVDIPSEVALELMSRVSNRTFVTFTNCFLCIPIATTTINDVQDYVNNTTVNPPACNLKWGGRFSPVDKVHFQLP